jgi:hypothetical protein
MFLVEVVEIIKEAPLVMAKLAEASMVILSPDVIGKVSKSANLKACISSIVTVSPCLK